MADNDRNTQPNPTLMQDAVLRQPTIETRLQKDPDFAPALLASEENALRNYTHKTRSAPPAAPHIERRLRPWGYLILLIWTASLTAAAILRRLRRRRD